MVNILPYKGIVNYYGKIFNDTETSYFYNSLLNNIVWKNDEAFIFGRLIITKEKLHGMVILNLNILIPISQKKLCHGLRN